MVNELLTVPKHSRLGTAKRVLLCNQFEALRQVYNALHGLENAEDGLVLPRLDAFQGMHRLSQRQIEWQRGFWTAFQIYRSAYIFGGSVTKEHFEEEVGVTLADFMYGCMILMSLFQEYSSVTVNGDALDLPKETLLKILQRIALPIGEARAKATAIRTPAGHTGYKPSVLRMHPCIQFGDKFLAPLPQLIALRSSAGVFYDIVGGPQMVRTEVGARFEAYCAELVQLSMPSFRIATEESYEVKRGQVMKTPDIRLYAEGRLAVVLECKATRMSYGAKFSEDPLADDARGYKEIAKGVYQIWRFLSHVRLGLVPGERTGMDVTGIVLTLDTWLTTANHLQKETLALAHELADKSGDEITEADRVGIAFCPIIELELTLRGASPASFLTAVRKAAEERYEGYFLSSVHDLKPPEGVEDTEYPFWSRIGDVLPWWNKLKEHGGL